MIQNIKLKPIEIDQANEEIEVSIKVKDYVKHVAKAKLNNSPDPKVKNRGKSFFDSKQNAFYFSAKEVLKFFLPDQLIPNPLPEGAADGILLLLGIHDRNETIPIPEGEPYDFKEGSPTVILAGVSKDGAQKYRTIDPAFYGQPNSMKVVEQYPPQITAQKFAVVSNNIYEVVDKP